MRHQTLLLTALLLSQLATLHAADSAKPNVVSIMADDLGWGDISLNGGGVPTPNIDRLFTQGVELRNFMGWCGLRIFMKSLHREPLRSQNAR